ncbi:hypothetical protein [Geodermatophilus amargosae]|uniref:hypothetical protein n=1 Tax=Geodermatophilus amargosae TaxID=1296565 RepID=UPI0034DEAE7B
MPSLQSRPGKVVVITLLSLVAAVVCFGLLSSSGVVDNGVVELGGAFAGFIVTVVTLNRVWGRDDIETEAAKSGQPFLYEEVVKTLDLRRASPHASPQLAHLTDYYRAKRLGTAHTLQMHYATTADGIDWRGSATHPTTARWQEDGVSHTGPDGETLKHDYKVDLDLQDLAVGQCTPVINSIAYRNAFRNLDGEWFETHIEQPTGHLTMIVLAPDDMQVTSAGAGRSIGRGDLEHTAEEPAVIEDGSVIYWSVDSPVLGARYAVSWTWSRRTARETLASGR